MIQSWRDPGRPGEAVPGRADRSWRVQARTLWAELCRDPHLLYRRSFVRHTAMAVTIESATSRHPPRDRGADGDGLGVGRRRRWPTQERCILRAGVRAVTVEGGKADSELSKHVGAADW